MIVELEADPRAALREIAASVIIFYAPWCADCKESENYEAELEKLFAGQVSFFRLDAVNLEEIADKYKVEKYPTYVFFHKGKPLRGALVEPVGLGEAQNWLEIQLEKLRLKKK